MSKQHQFKIFLKIISVLIVILSLHNTTVDASNVRLSPRDTKKEIIWKAAHVKPSPRQLAWQQLEFTAFAHFGMNTFTNKEWGDGTEDPKLFNPIQFDAHQWMKVLKDAGIKMIILTAKHHDGFCLWPSKYTEHSVKNSSWRAGKGDIVREVSDAAREAGIKFGVYLSPWDRHEKTFGTPAYDTHYKNQLRELLTQYGEISEVWMDGACGEQDPRCKNVKYDIEGFSQIVHKLQPNAVVAIYGNDVRWVGNEAGKPRQSEWSVQPDTIDHAAPDLGSIDRLIAAAKKGETLRWYTSETDVSIRTGWFYHTIDDYTIKSLEQLLDIYYGSVGGNSQLLLNIPPDKRGLINNYDAKRLRELQRVISETFESDFALHAKSVASAVRSGGKYSPEMTNDGDNTTFWSTNDGVESASIEYDLGLPRTFNVVMLQEHIADGQRIEEFSLDAWDGSAWKEIARSTTVGYKRLLRFDRTTAQRVRLRIARSRVCPTLSSFGLFFDKTRK